MNNECCKILSSQEWDKKQIVWRDKPFHKSRYWSVFHVPVNMGTKIIRGLEEIEEAGLSAEQMVLSRRDSFLGAELLVPISGKTDAFEIELITGRFLTRLFDGNYGDMEKWVKVTRTWCREQNFEPEEYIFWYATCPKCAKKRNDRVQMVVLAKVG
ncbi:MAG: hypothetical protein PHF35_04475 [Candidatus Moranbacteria bacterium]|nr:hypothetical protein [Candidatus Moranbacteria bacterium]